METASQLYPAAQTTPYPPGMLSGAANVPQPADTLVRAITRIDELNKRPSALSAGTYKIAEAIGGPYPVQGQAEGDPSSPTAMSRLNRGIDQAHRTAGELEEAMNAIRRSLGA